MAEKNFNEESNVKEDDISIEEKTINEECNCDLPDKECCSDEEEKIFPLKMRIKVWKMRKTVLNNKMKSVN